MSRDIKDIRFSINIGKIIGNHDMYYLLSPELKSIDPVHFGEIYEPATTLFFLGAICNLPKNSIMIDIGANIGYYSVLCASNRKDMKIFSFEPHDVVYEALKKNSEIYNNIIPNHCGISHIKDENAILYCDNRNLGGHSFINSLESWGDKMGFQENIGMYKIACSLKNIRDFNIDFTKVSLIKIDVQGMEYDILMDVYDILPDNTIISIENNKQVVEFAQKNNLKLVFSIGIENVYQK